MITVAEIAFEARLTGLIISPCVLVDGPRRVSQCAARGANAPLQPSTVIAIADRARRHSRRPPPRARARFEELPGSPQARQQNRAAWRFKNHTGHAAAA